MNVTVKTLPKSQVELTIELSADEIQNELAGAATRISEGLDVKGFRPGKAPYEVVKNQVGEMSIWKEAADDIIRHSFSKAVLDHKLESIGSPEIDLVKFAPGNPLIYKATVTTLPKITKLADYHSITVEKKEVTVGDEDLEKALKELQRMQTEEIDVDRGATEKDKITVDMSMFLDNVPLDGGQTKDHGIILSEDYYIPGLKKELVGLKANDEKKFKLQFPAEHYQKNIAGKDVLFKIKVKKVQELKAPTLDDEFAKKLGQESVDVLKKMIRKNLEEEAQTKEAQRTEIAMLEEIVKATSYDDIPEKLLDQETEQMTHEFEHSLVNRGMDFGEYLKKINKSRADIKLEFAPQATSRIKTALAIKEIAKQESIEPDEKEIADEITKLMNEYKDNADAQKQIREEDFSDSIRAKLRNRKTIEWLKETIIK